MKVFKAEEQAKKSWALDFERGNAALFVSAVNSVTGDKIARLIGFYDDGKVVVCTGVENALVSCGYDPHEHGNAFDDAGRLLVRPRIFANEFGTESAGYVVKTDGPNEQVVRYRDLVSILGE